MDGLFNSFCNLFLLQKRSNSVWAQCILESVLVHFEMDPFASPFWCLLPTHSLPFCLLQPSPNPSVVLFLVLPSMASPPFHLREPSLPLLLFTFSNPLVINCSPASPVVHPLMASAPFHLRKSSLLVLIFTTRTLSTLAPHCLSCSH